MSEMEKFPARSRKNIRKLSSMLSSDPETVYAMMLMTATLTDLRPEDNKVVEYILLDCGLETEIA